MPLEHRRLVDLSVVHGLLAPQEPVHLVRTKRTDISVLQRVVPIYRAFGPGAKILVLPEVDAALSEEELENPVAERIEFVKHEKDVVVISPREPSGEILVVVRPTSLGIDLCATMNRVQITLGQGTAMLMIPAIGCALPDQAKESTDDVATDLRQREVQVWPLTGELYGLLSLLDA